MKEEIRNKLILCFSVILILFQTATQIFASRLEYHRLLGDPLFHLGSVGIYFPWKYAIWFRDLGPIVPRTAIIAGLPFIIAIGFIFIIGLRSAKKPLSYHGTAAWAKINEVRRMGLFSKSGAVCGEFSWKEYGITKKKRLIHDDKHHMIVLAPTRSGKGVGLIVPTLLGEWTESCIITDIKGENWGITAGFRQQMGQKVIKFDPTCNDGSGARWNPIEEIRFGTKHEIQDIQNIANVIVDPEGKGNLDHWKMSASNLIVGLICHMYYAYRGEPDKYPKPTLASLANNMKSSLKEERDPETGQMKVNVSGFFETVEGLVQFPHFKEGMTVEIFDENPFSPTFGKVIEQPITPEYMKTIYPEASSLDNPATNFIHPICFSAFVDITTKAENERASVVSTANTVLGVYADPILAQNTAASDFHIWDVMNSEQPVSLYLVTPPSDISRLSSQFRLLVDMLVKRNIERMEFEKGKQITTYKHKCLLLLDEFPALGRMDSFETSLAYIAGYGLKAYMICQGLPQLYKTYTKDTSVVMNCHIRIFYAPNENETAQYIEKSLGNFTERVKTKSYSGSSFFPSVNRSESFISRPLMTAEEVGRLGDKEIVMMTGEPPILCDKIKYYLEKDYTSRLMDAPAKSDVIPPYEKVKA